jgi:hypothetical protein
MFRIPREGTPVNLQELLERIPNAHRKIFKIYSPQHNGYIEFKSFNSHQQPYTLPRDLLKLNVHMIKYIEADHFDSCDLSFSSDEVKKERSGERNIREVIELVQKWRLHHSDPPDGKRKTLQEAAKLVGVSKKSLDDYYYQLRVGEKH